MSVAFDLIKSKSLGLVRAQDLETPTTIDESLALHCPELEKNLPDKGLPHGVVELASSGALGGATRVALAAVRGGQSKGPKAWCAWLDPEGSLHAPGVAKAGVDLQRMLVVRPPRKDLAHAAVKLAESRAFEVIVVDFAPPFLVDPRATGHAPKGLRKRRTALRPEVFVRKLALLADQGGSTVVLMTDAREQRPIPWPVALRLELARSPHALTVKVAKDRFCRVASGRIAWPVREEALGAPVVDLPSVSRASR